MHINWKGGNKTIYRWNDCLCRKSQRMYEFFLNSRTHKWVQQDPRSKHKKDHISINWQWTCREWNLKHNAIFNHFKEDEIW